MATGDAIKALQERFPELNLTARPLVTYLDGRTSDQLCVRVPFCAPPFPRHAGGVAEMTQGSARVAERTGHSADVVLAVMRFLRDDPRTRFEQLCDLTCVDYLGYPGAEDRFGVIYSLLSLTHNHRLWIKVFVNDPDPQLPSVYAIWHGAEWPEREVYDLFGIRFTGHPDLRRIVLPQNFKDHPLRKDYPLRGKGEREDFEVVTRETA